MTTAFFYGPDYESLERAARNEADELAGDAPACVLWLEQNDHRTDQIADVWAAEHDPLRIEVASLGDLVDECYEALTGPRTLLDALTRRQLVDHALRTLEDGILDDAHRYRGEVVELFTELEGDGYDSPAAVQRLSDESPLTERAATVLAETYDRFIANRERTTTDEEYTRSEAYRTIVDADDGIDDLLPNVDVVVASGYYDLSDNQRGLFRKMVAELPLVVATPLVDADRTSAPNAVATDTAAFFREIVDRERRIEPESDSRLAEIAGELYAASTNESHPVPEGTLRWVESPTPDREVRQVARSLRDRLANDAVDPNDVLVVVPGLISYRERIEDTFDAHGIEAVTFANKLLYQTDAGRAMLDLVALCDERSAMTLAQLATNPVVSLEDVAGATVSDLARRLSTDDPETLLSELDGTSREALDELLDRTDAITELDGVAVVDAIRSLFETIDLEDNVAEIGESTADFDAAMERRAYRRVDRVLDAIERAARQLDARDVLSRIADELDQVRVPPPRQVTDGVVEVVGPRDAFMQSYDHLYLVGLTERDFPPDPERPLFFEELEEGLYGIETTDHRAVARYQFATMLASADSVFVTTPEMTVDDDPLLESSILDELSRVMGIEPTEHDLGNACREDVQRAIGRGETISASDAVEQAIDAGVFDRSRRRRVRRGVECAEHRASAGRTAHDGQLDPETVAALHPSDDREPYSPTQLTGYATCGFRYYMERVLDIEAPEEFTLEPDPLELGSLVHDVLVTFYRELQDEPGDPVDLGDYSREALEERLLGAGEAVLAAAELPYADTFYRRWLEALFAGLCDPERNDYYGTDEGGVHESAEGLFVRFLEAERDRDASPGWFEVGMDLTANDGATFDLELPDGRTIPIGGRIDRVTVDRTEDPPSGIVHDYKTGRQGTRHTVDGVDFQLPLYALAAGNVLEDDGIETPLDAAFYILDPPDTVRESWDLRYYIGRQGGGTDDDYEPLIEEVTPRRIGAIVDGIEGGAFQPTVLDADDANCRYCDYRNVCDVRYHRRRDVVEAIDADGDPGYVPQYARGESLLDAFGGDDE